MESSIITIPNLVFLAVVGVYLLLLGFMLTWLYFDAEQRGVNGYLIVGVAFFTGTILGTLAWLLLRPHEQVDAIPARN